MNVRQREDFTRAAHIMRLLNVSTPTKIDFELHAYNLDRAVALTTIERVFDVIEALEENEVHMKGKEVGVMSMMVGLLRGYMV